MQLSGIKLNVSGLGNTVFNFYFYLIMAECLPGLCEESSKVTEGSRLVND